MLKTKELEEKEKDEKEKREQKKKDKLINLSCEGVNMQEKYYDDNILSDVEGLLSEADDFLNDAKSQVDSAFNGLNSETKSITSKPIVPSAKPDLEEAYKFANNMQELTSKIGASRLDLENQIQNQTLKTSSLNISSGAESGSSEINQMLFQQNLKIY